MAEKGPPPSASRDEQASRVPRWTVVLAALVLAGVSGVIIYGYVARPGWVGVSDKKFWDYLDLLIVPAAIAIGVTVINWMQSARQRQAEEAQRVREQQMEDLQRQRELEVERQRAMDIALETYLDRMERPMVELSEPLAEGKVETSAVFSLVRARTLTLLERLDGSRKRAVMRLLQEAGMISIRRTGPGLLLDLHDANFSDADLTHMNLSDQNLSGARLTEANLASTVLWDVNLQAANLKGAVLTGASLGMVGAQLHVPGEVDAEPAQPRLAKLNAADLSYANLEGSVGWTVEQLTSAKSLEGATMPNGQKYEDWLKDREGREEDGQGG